MCDVHRAWLGVTLNKDGRSWKVLQAEKRVWAWEVVVLWKHHFETTVETIVGWYLHRNHHSRVS